MANQVSVINSSYCVSHPVTLQINTERGVTYDENDHLLFYIDDPFFTLHKRRVLYDDTKNPIATLYTKIMTLHRRCKVFKGETNDSSQLLFSVKEVKKSSKMPREITKLDVFLANNQDEKKSDFRVVISGSKSSCTVYAGESPNVVAQMENNGGFNVSVNPNVDYAFIVALLMIVKDINCSSEPKDSSNDTITALKAVKVISSLA